MKAGWFTRRVALGAVFFSALITGCATSQPTLPLGLTAAEQQTTAAATRAERAAQRAEAAAIKATAAADRVEQVAQRVASEALQAEKRFTQHMRK